MDVQLSEHYIYSLKNFSQAANIKDGCGNSNHYVHHHRKNNINNETIHHQHHHHHRDSDAKRDHDVKKESREKMKQKDDQYHQRRGLSSLGDRFVGKRMFWKYIKWLIICIIFLLL